MAEKEANSQLLQGVLEATKQGKLRWEATETADAYRSTIEDTSIVASKKSRPSAIIYSFSMRDSAGNELVGESARKSSYSGRTDADFEMLEDLYERARRSAFDVDSKVNRVLQILKQG